MGVLLNATIQRKKIKRTAPLEAKRRIVMDELKTLNVTVSRSGRPLDELDYEELKEEWVMASILWVDIENENHRWFR